MRTGDAQLTADELQRRFDAELAFGAAYQGELDAAEAAALGAGGDVDATDLNAHVAARHPALATSPGLEDTIVVAASANGHGILGCCCGLLVGLILVKIRIWLIGRRQQPGSATT